MSSNQEHNYIESEEEREAGHVDTRHFTTNVRPLTP